MHAMRRRFRSAIDAVVPTAGQLYRQWREIKASVSPPLMTPYGFKLSGEVSMACTDFERDEVEVVCAYLSRTPVCVDVGANVGFYTCLAASRGRYVVAVEPVAANVKVLMNNLMYNGFHRVEVHPLGLSSEVGVHPIHGRGTGASFVPGWAGMTDERCVPVPVTTLDLVLGGRFEGTQIFVKVDVEGVEHEVIRGASRTLLQNPKPVWLIEICLNEHFPSGLNRDFQQIFETMWQHGYEARVAAPSERLVCREDVNRWIGNGHVDFGSHNYLFVHP